MNLKPRLAPDGKTEVILQSWTQSVVDPELWIFWNDGEEFYYGIQEERVIPEHTVKEFKIIGAKCGQDGN